jgi:hypothetical protein
VKVDLEQGVAVIHPAKGRTFDPAGIPCTVRDAGFSSPEVFFTAKGRLEKEGERLALRVPGLRHVFYLEGGAGFAELKAATTFLNKTIRVSGKLHGSHAERPPGMTVEKFESAGDSP